MFSLLLYIILPLLISGDLPIHCLHRQVVGTWHLAHNQPSLKPMSCGHTYPDNPLTMPNLKINNKPLDYNNPNFNITGIVTVKLEGPNKAIDKHGNNGTCKYYLLNKLLKNFLIFFIL